MITHKGIIEKINSDKITVRILQQSACSSCHARGACMAADSKEKIVELTDHTGQFTLHEQVIIEGKESIGYKAVFWAFLLPLIILIVMLVLTTGYWHFSEMEAALSALLALTPYYLLLYLLRNKMAHTFQFSIKKNH
ncbi:MAG: SoxR reducing system RseC family protein [Proteiniphilum sp.]|jgi:sigma-E factor negative regulatory protein RseC|nr:SoxR reducing system RseC family protein [Proteiniphilum sp.]NCD14470.1 Fis family transcriptional regulator [Bacteroidia bacterium]HHT34146.1 SoxR reducing system RseC family protein [Bacteroidales bacterium]MDD2727273.1 SoxR reducing system RseC family protein [Proteiniphilum sp.]MDD3332051.1 SoxR reducing system RseC family protein [Proteiniphilum sp.]